jgi:hypothetical protein
MRVVVVALLLAGCGRLGFDATPNGGTGDGGGGSGSGSACVDPPATKHVPADGDFYTVVMNLAPGDVVEVSGGPYTSPGGAVHQTWAGTAAAPILVRAAPGMRPVLNATAGNNVLDVDGSYFTLRGFELVGGDIGFRFGADQHATLEDLDIHNQIDQGISCNRTGQSCDSITIRAVEIANTGGTMTGNGISLGCADMSCTASNTVVEGCYIHDLAGSGGAGISVWYGDNNILRDNVFARTSGPGMELQVSAATQPDIIERNYVTAAMDNGIQLEGMAIIRNNIVTGGTNDGISSRLELGVNPVNLQIVHNTIIGAASACVRGANWSGTSQVISNNAFSCPVPFVATGTPITTGNVDVTAADTGAPPNVYPTSSSRVIDAGDPTYGVADDFNRTPRSGTPDSGAYEHTSATNPGWLPAEGLKPLPVSTCP